MYLGLIISLMFINAHNYDLIVLTPILAAVLFRFGTAMPRIALSLVGIAAVYFRMRAMKALEGLPELRIRWREMLMTAGTWPRCSGWRRRPPATSQRLPASVMA